MAVKHTIQLVKVEYKAVDIQRYYRSVDGGKLVEILGEHYREEIRSLKTIESGSEDYADRLMLYRLLQKYD